MHIRTLVTAAAIAMAASFGSALADDGSAVAYATEETPVFSTMMAVPPMRTLTEAQLESISGQGHVFNVFLNVLFADFHSGGKEFDGCCGDSQEGLPNALFHIGEHIAD